MMIKSIFILIAFNIMVMPAVAQDQYKTDEEEGDIVADVAATFVPPEGMFRTIPEKSDLATEEHKFIGKSYQVNFETNSAELTAETWSLLRLVARGMTLINTRDLDFIIEGHTDSRGGYDINQALSEKRAKAVLNYLVQNFQIDRGRLTAVGKNYSQLEDPEEPNSWRNRRVEFKMVGYFQKAE